MKSVTLEHPVHLDITLEDNAMVSDIKKALKLIKGISSIRTVKPKTAKPKVQYTEEEFYAKIDASLESGLSSWVMEPGESAEEFMMRVSEG